ncbi:MAG TPA: response regulator, partial [Candidatus Dormibacteraeota bacterium]|nr:response regulator [Candidatus Dormibacteraeota bacterium]
MLVVDDDASIAAALRRALLYEGYAVTVAADGVTGLQRAQADSPDLVILDIMLPGIDGLEVCRRIRADDDVPVLMLTARDDTADRVLG